MPNSTYRSDQEIVDQTEMLARFLMSEIHHCEVRAGYLLRNSNHPRSRDSWELACKIQELLTNTDVQNALAEIEDEVSEKVDINAHFTSAFPEPVHDITHAGSVITFHFESAEAARKAYNAIEASQRIAANIG